jgi:hypothetical protein
MKSKEISETTTNRGEFNRAYKFYLEHSGKIRCCYCRYNRGENDRRKCYGGYADDGGVKNPSWKLTSKNPKQWMDKGVRITVEEWGWKKLPYTRINF